MTYEPTEPRETVTTSDAATAAVALRAIPQEAIEFGAQIAAEIAFQHDLECRRSTERDAGATDER